MASSGGETAAQPQLPTQKRRFKISSVVDQGDDQEVDALLAAEFRTSVKRFRACNDGLDPSADEEATPDQLQGMAVKLAQDVVPFADFGVLRPFGQRLERTLKFHARCWDPIKAELVAKELPGPPSVDEWLRSWKVFTFIMLALGAVTRARLERYRDKIVGLSAKFGRLRGCTWWIIALADQRMRSERMEKLRRMLESDAAEGRPATAGGFDKDRPWDAVFLAAANDSEFWNEEVREAALLFISRVKDREELADPGHHVRADGEWQAGEQRPDSPDGERGGRGKAKGRRDREKKKSQGVKEQQQQTAKSNGPEDKGKSKGDKGKAKGKGKSRVQVCFAWNRDAGGCPSPCPNGRSHICETCGSADHKGSECKKAW